MRTKFLCSIFPFLNNDACFVLRVQSEPGLTDGVNFFFHFLSVTYERERMSEEKVGNELSRILF